MKPKKQFPATHRVYEVKPGTSGETYDLWRVTPKGPSYLASVPRSTVVDQFPRVGRYRVKFQVLPAEEFFEATHYLQGGHLMTNRRQTIGHYCGYGFKRGTGINQRDYDRPVPLRVTTRWVSAA